MSIFIHPLLSNLQIGSGEWFQAQREMIRNKPAIERCYNLWYSKLLDDVSTVEEDGLIVELGSGSSYIQEIEPRIITSDIVFGPADLVIDGCALPFRDHTLKALLLTHVFHHIPDVRQFLKEASRVLVPGGVISMIDCAHTPLSRFFFKYIHPEPYDYKASRWEFPPGDTMLDSNQALTYLVFDRDFETFKTDFPNLVLEERSFLPWFSYLLSGGVNLRSLVPKRLAGFFAKLDQTLKPFDKFGAIHWHIRIRSR